MKGGKTMTQMIIAMSESDKDSFIADYERRQDAANLYADECATILAAQTGVEISRINREPFVNHHFSQSLNGKEPNTPVVQVEQAVEFWRPEYLGIAEVTP
jgi:hypothetical protein